MMLMSFEQDILSARILIVDDQPANVQLMRRVLHDAGYSQVEATLNSSEVCVLHAAHAYDLILLDLQMPGMDGFSVMEGLRADELESYLPVIVLTAQPAHKLRALQAGARDFIAKPFDLAEVKTRIHHMLELRLLHRKLAEHNDLLEQMVLARTESLRDSEARYRALTELASDWFWEQDASGEFTKVSGPVLEVLGLGPAGSQPLHDGWNAAQRQVLRAHIAARRPFLDFTLERLHGDGSSQKFLVSGEPIFDLMCRFIGYRGIGFALPQVPAASQPIASAAGGRILS